MMRAPREGCVYNKCACACMWCVCLASSCPSQPDDTTGAMKQTMGVALTCSIRLSQVKPLKLVESVILSPRISGDQFYTSPKAELPIPWISHSLRSSSSYPCHYSFSDPKNTRLTQASSLYIGLLSKANWIQFITFFLFYDPIFLILMVLLHVYFLAPTPFYHETKMRLLYSYFKLYCINLSKSIPNLGLLALKMMRFEGIENGSYIP